MNPDPVASAAKTLKALDKFTGRELAAAVGKKCARAVKNYFEENEK